MAFAFFDLDQTLVPWDTQALFCRHVLRREGWRRAYLPVFAPVVPLAAVKLVRSRGLKRVFLSYLWRMPLERLARHVEEFVSEAVLPIVYPEVRAELERHRSEGRITILNTASPDIYAENIAAALGFDHCFATRVPLPASGRVPFCPRIAGPNNKREAKLSAMRHLLPPGATDPGAPPLADSFAYSDSHADLPMLRLAEHPVMVHPDKTLAAIGRPSGWRELHPPRPFAGRWGYRLGCLRQAVGV
ncbi:MAG: HAD-IB family hydrolase [Verrucomicrobiales bacterium]|nr:HAD-IB family hydrolase [Verrucomicrobiales bacterium]